jgi:hypothetical protein
VKITKYTPQVNNKISIYFKNIGYTVFKIEIWNMTSGMEFGSLWDKKCERQLNLSLISEA